MYSELCLLIYEINEATTKKCIGTGKEKVFFARKWNSTWPTNDDVIPDFGYASINPCRQGGVIQDCCYFDLVEDPHEDNPLSVDCLAHAQYANESYYDPQLCEDCPQL
jgi:hypothetical protein